VCARARTRARANKVGGNGCTCFTKFY